MIKSSGADQGTVSVRYEKSGSKHKHEMKAIAKTGYKFEGWYIGDTLMSTNVSYITTTPKSFSYMAKFVER